MRWGFSMNCDAQDGEHYWTTFDAGLYEPAGVRAFIDRLRRLLEASRASPG